jgi:serine/threonine-protein phosphatase 2B catalytic subunit
MVIEAKQHAVGGKNEKVSFQDESRVKGKMTAVMHMLRIFKTLREENETVMQLKGVCPGHRLAPGLIMQGKAALTSELERFKQAQLLDAKFEKRPAS